MMLLNNQRDNFYYIKKYGSKILAICIILESIFFYSFPNILGSLVCYYGWWLFKHIVFKKENFQTYFLPTLAITGYIIMYYVLPIIVTLIEFKPLTFNFEVPIIFWFNQFLNISCIILAYHWSKSRFHVNNCITFIWKKLGYFLVPTDKQIWTFGFLGLLALIYNVINQTTLESYEDMQTGATGGFISSVITTIQGLSIMPLWLFFREYYGSYKKIANKKTIIIYTALILLLSIATTKRSLIIYPIFSLLIIYIIDATINNKQIISRKKLFFTILSIILLSGPITDLALAMSLNRHNIKGSDTLKEVLELYNDKEKLYKLKQTLSVFAGMNIANNDEGWSEYYVDNIFLDRFCNLRVQDATIYYAQKLGYDNREMHQFAKDFIIFRIPTFITDILGEKKVVLTSPADKIYENYFNVPNFIGQKVGGDIGIGLYWLGYKYYMFAIIIYFFTFYFLGSITTYKNYHNVIPIPILCSLSSYFLFFINSQGIFRSINLLLRSGIQGIIIYCFIFFIIRKFIK